MILNRKQRSWLGTEIYLDFKVLGLGFIGDWDSCFTCNYSYLSSLSLTVCRPGGLDLWNLLTKAQMRLMADAQAVTSTMLTRMRNIWGRCPNEIKLHTLAQMMYLV